MRSIARVVVFIFLVVSCEEHNPKPKAFLRLDYREAKYRSLEANCPYEVLVNDQTKISYKGCNMEVYYPAMKATIYINFRPVQSNLKLLLEDAQKFTFEHVIKAQSISERAYQDEKNKVYGMMYKVGGDAASQIQFYLTDSIHNFLSGSLYFYALPNYDSLLPAMEYINKDITKFMESLRWKK